MAITRKKNLGLLLIEAGIIEPEQLEQALLKQAKEANSGYIGDILISTGLIDEKTRNRFLSQQLHIPSVELGHFEVDKSDIRDGILNYKPSNNRSQIIKKIKNDIVLDAYNANPSSMILAIQNFEKLKSDNKILILGDMFELGKDQINYHQEIIDYCEKMDVKKIYLVGSIFSKTRFSKKFTSFTSCNEVIKSNEFKNISKSIFFLKGSRSIQLEKLVNYIP